jgi:predicted esterase
MLPLLVVLGDETLPSATLARSLADLPTSSRTIALASGPISERGLGDAADALAATLVTLRAQWPTLGLPVVLGYGAGANVALALAARSPASVGGVVAIAGSLPEQAVPAAAPVARPGTPLRVYVLHGTRDDVVPAALGSAASDVLALRGLSAVLHLDPRAGHELSAHLLAEARARANDELGAAR